VFILEAETPAGYWRHSEKPTLSPRNYSSRLVSWRHEEIGYAGNFAIWVLL